VTLKEELTLCATLDSLYEAGVDIRGLLETAKKIGLQSWVDSWMRI
jgi:hypothetical protein